MASVFKRAGKGKWYAAWIDHNGRQKTACAHTTDKAAAERIAKKKEADAALRRDGVIDASEDRFGDEGRRELSAHLANYKASLVARENTQRYCDETENRIRKVLTLCKAAYPKDLTASAVEQAIRSLRDGGSSLRTCNAYQRDVKSFAAWLVADKRLRANPLVSLKAYNAATDRRYVRRALSDEELVWLIRAAENSTRHEFSLKSADRAMLYRVALGTGFRADELRSLTPKSFELAGERPTVTVAAAYSKRREEDVQPISRDLADQLHPWLSKKTAGERVFGRLPKASARMLRCDLAAARKAWLDEAGDDAKERQRREESDFLCLRNHAGEIADFHATRHTYISQLVDSGATVKK